MSANVENTGYRLGPCLAHVVVGGLHLALLDVNGVVVHDKKLDSRHVNGRLPI